MGKEIIAKEGMEVHVISADKKKILGFGTITKVVEARVFDDEECIFTSANYPLEITLENGTTLEGADCWWFPVEFIDKEFLKKLKNKEPIPVKRLD